MDIKINTDTERYSKLYTTIIKSIGILGISYTFFGLLSGWGFYFGLKIILLFGGLMFVHGFMRSRSLNYRKSFIHKVINLGVTIVLLSTIFMELVIFTGAFFNHSQDEDYLLILGAGIYEDRPCLELKNRLDRAIQIIEGDNSIKKIVLCGGKGTGKQYTEAYVMEKYLLSHGIDGDMLLKEEESTTTNENIVFAIKMIEDLDPDANIGLVSNYFHIYRAKWIAKKYGLNATGLPAKTPILIIPNHHVREYFAIIKCWFLNK